MGHYYKIKEKNTGLYLCATEGVSRYKYYLGNKKSAYRLFTRDQANNTLAELLTEGLYFGIYVDSRSIPGFKFKLVKVRPIPSKPPEKGSAAWLIEHLQDFPPDTHVLYRHPSDDTYRSIDKVLLRSVKEGKLDYRGEPCICLESYLS